MIPLVGHRKWMSENTWMLIEERNKIKCLMAGHCSERLGRDLQTQYRAMNKAVKRSVRCDKRKQIADLARDAEEAAFNGDIKTIYKITKQLINKNLTTQQPVKDENGRLLNSDEEQLARWRSHFSSVLNHNLAENAPPLSAEPLRYNNNPRIKEDAPSVAEIRDAIKSLPNNKAAGIDGIPA